MARSSPRARARTNRLHHLRRDRPDRHHGASAGSLPRRRTAQQGARPAPDGNFVLTEIEVTAAPQADPKQARPVKLKTPLADFSQEGYAVAQAIDGDSTNQGAGWAVSPTTGVPHWATFETESPIGKPGGTVITVRLHHRFNAPQFTLGRFRLAITRVPRPLGLGVTDEFRSILAIVPELRTEAQRNAAAGLHADHGRRLARQRSTALAASKAPLPVDQDLPSFGADSRKPGDPSRSTLCLSQLRHDLEMSIQQAATAG